MKEDKLSRSKILELANVFLSNVVSIYELEKICNVPVNVILHIFRKDLYNISLEKAESVNKILNAPGYLECTGYIKENVYYYQY